MTEICISTLLIYIRNSEADPGHWRGRQPSRRAGLGCGGLGGESVGQNMTILQNWSAGGAPLDSPLQLNHTEYRLQWLQTA